MRRLSDEARRAGRRVVLVPTMGYLHEGHLTLMREGRRRADLLVVSVFVNPTQFGPNEDFSRYPRDIDRDRRLMEAVPVDVVFTPEVSDMYLPGAQTWVEVGALTTGLCGAHRPNHFRGVTTVVAKLFNIVNPHAAFFGEKDFQQLRAIQRMVADLNWDIEIVPVPIVREPDGLAMSSRNAYLNPVEREQALALSRALAKARQAFFNGERETRELIKTARTVLDGARDVKLEYLEAVDGDTLSPVATVSRPVLVAVAALVGQTRLIDNILLVPQENGGMAAAGPQD